MKLLKYKLRFFFDYGAGGCLWGDNEATQKSFGLGPLDETIMEKTSLISGETFAEIEQIDLLHSTYLNQDYPPDPSLWTQDKCNQFNNRVDNLLEQLRRDLGDEFEIVDKQERYKQDPNLEKYLADRESFKRNS